MSARSILDALDPEKYEITQIGITRQGTWLISQQADRQVLESLLAGEIDLLSAATLFPDPSRPGLFAISQDQGPASLNLLAELDVIFPVLHGTFGEDGTIQGLFEMADVAYVGAGVLASSVAMDKGVFKHVMIANNVPVVDGILVTRNQIENEIESLVAELDEWGTYPLFVKPANLGSSVGVSKVQSRSDLLEGLMEAARYDRRVLIERGINAREIEVSVLGNATPLASIPGEIVPHGDFYSYDSKYHDDRSELLIPAPLDAQQIEQIQAIAIQAYKAIDCAGLARVDFLLDKDSGAVYLNEINTMPGFTNISMYPKLWDATGIVYPELIDRLVDLALARKAERDKTEREFHRSA